MEGSSYNKWRYFPVELSTGVALVLKDKRENKKVRNKQESTSERKK
jgi:hypothetical protein